ncbi:hypothetical protein WJX81_005872 [Elliptochloris bilobata]|uniref:Uncharacterized protein n=1 Tax=Elliptochloris bilobata TaxID=381761 RepID=A0AAW1S465_9CHLO
MGGRALLTPDTSPGAPGYTGNVPHVHICNEYCVLGRRCFNGTCVPDPSVRPSFELAAEAPAPADLRQGASTQSGQAG